LIRFIDLGKQIAQDQNDPDWPREFALYDTLQASFLCFGGMQVFDCRQDILDNMDDNDQSYTKKVLSVRPEWVPKANGTMVR
jgi:hypothetical protein